MLNKEDNAILTQVGAGTPMGELMRRYWLPFLYSEELAPDGPPLRVRLLGENLIAFRDSKGQVALLGDNCPHRGASLFYGRNEEDGLRCVYHGWKFDAGGKCVDMPNEPTESNFKHKIHHTAYRCAEQAGLVFAYMGPDQGNPPPLPQFDWSFYPEAQVRHSMKAVMNSNYLQNLEGDLDTSHVGVLHWGTVPGQIAPQDYVARDLAPHLEVIDTDYGMMYSARRNASPGELYWRTSQYIMPFYTLFPAWGNGDIPAHIWVPIDDEHTLAFEVMWNPTAAIPDRRAHLPMQAAGPMLPEQHGKFFSHWWPALSADNDYGLDREVQRTQTFTGIPTIRLQDLAMTVSMGPVADRAQEHLGTADTMIIRTRRRLMTAVKALRDQATQPPAVNEPEKCRVRSSTALLVEGADWRTSLGDWLTARVDAVPSCMAATVTVRQPVTTRGAAED